MNGKLRGKKMMSPEKVEREFKRPRNTPVNLFLVTNGERSVLEKEIEKYHGVVLLMVHPFWYKKPQDLQPQHSPNSFPEKNDLPERLINFLSKPGPPLIIALDPRNMQVDGEFPRWYSTLPANHRPVYFYSTLPEMDENIAHPEPYDKRVPELQTPNGRWDHLTQVLQRLGVTKIIIGGSNTIAHNKYELALECVPSTMRILRNHFSQVLLSNLTLPHSPAYLMDWENDLKVQTEYRLTRGERRKRNPS